MRPEELPNAKRLFFFVTVFGPFHPQRVAKIPTTDLVRLVATVTDLLAKARPRFSSINVIDVIIGADESCVIPWANVARVGNTKEFMASQVHADRLGLTAADVTITPEPTFMFIPGSESVRELFDETEALETRIAERVLNDAAAQIEAPKWKQAGAIAKRLLDDARKGS